MTASDRYTRTAIALHWIVGTAIVVNVLLALTWEFYPDALVRPAIDTHKSIGVTLIGLITLRLLWRLTHRPPPLPAHHKPWEKRAAHAVHIALYVLMFTMPLSGYIMDSAWAKAPEVPMAWFGLFEWPRIAPIMALDAPTKLAIHGGFGTVHEVTAFILYLLVFVHIAAALKHQFVDRDRELGRMGLGTA